MQPRVSVPKIFRRGNRWYVRVQVPIKMQHRLKKKEYWVSLRTSDRAMALRVAAAVTQEKRFLIENVYRRLSNLKETITELTEEQLLALGREAYERLAEPARDYVGELEASKYDTLKAFSAAKEEALDGAIEKLRVSRGDHPTINIAMLSLMEDNGIRLPTDSVANQQLRDICVDAFIDANRRSIMQLAGVAVPPNADPRFTDKQTGKAHGYVPLRRQLAAPPPPVPSLTELVDRFLNNPNKLRTAKTKASVRGYLGVVIQILGDDTALEDIRGVDCERVRDLIMQLPPNFNKLSALKDRPIDEMVRIARATQMPTLSPTGVNNYLRWLITFLTWCKKREMIDRLPIAFDELKVADPVRREDKRLSFSDEQLGVIFNSRIYQTQQRDSSLFWVPLIAVWNGMRSNEICQLDVADVKQVNDIWGFDITHIGISGDNDKFVKTGSSIRIVPIHPKLIEFGFLDFHHSRKGKAKLFGDITRGSDGYYSTNFSKTSNRYLKEIGVHGPKHKFHSLRHTFGDALRRGRVDREIGKALGGWRRGNTDAFDIYGSGYSLEELADELVRVDYTKVDWTAVAGGLD